VIVLADDAGSMIADRNFWYTAISRARTACLVIGPRGVFERQVKRVALARRRTFLTELILTPVPVPNPRLAWAARWREWRTMTDAGPGSMPGPFLPTPGGV
jgi:hypothetical protein